MEEVMPLLGLTYWADKRSPEQVKRSMEHSECYGVRERKNGKLIGFARVITDFATTYYLCDVIIHPDYRHMGCGTALVSYIVNLPALKDLRAMLITRDTHRLYEKFGFEVLNDRFMVRGLNY